MVPPINKNLKREQWIRSIFRDPTEVILKRRGGGADLTLSARMGNPSQSRRLGMAGLHEEIPDLECKIALPVDSLKPEAQRDRVTVGDSTYRIVESTELPGADCYVLTLSLDT